MKKLLSMLAASHSGTDDELSGDTFEVAGRAVRCTHCGGEHFVEGRAQLNTAGLTFLNLDWANRSAATLMCVHCGRIEWFLADPVERA